MVVFSAEELAQGNKAGNLSNHELGKHPATSTQKMQSAEAQLARLGLATLGVCLVDPALRLMDTACVGQDVSGEIFQAALVPCTSLLTFAFYQLYALGQSLTNFFAMHTFDQKDLNKDTQNRELCLGAINAALGMTALLSCIASSLMVIKADLLLKLVGTTNELLPSARSYLRICAPALPFAMFATVIQGAFLGMQNALLPFKMILLIAFPINLFGDIFLTLKHGFGIGGVAIATAVAQTAACAGFAVALSREPWWDGHRTCKQSLWRNAIRKEVVKPLTRVAVALMLRGALAISSYSVIAYFAAFLPVQQLAAHQISWQLYWLFLFTGEALSIAIQSIVAKEFKINPKKSRRFVQAGVRLSLQLGLFLTGLSFVILRCDGINRFLSSSPEVRAILSGPLSLYASFAQIGSSLALAIEGCVIATGESSNMPKVFGMSLAACVATLYVSTKKGFGLFGVWLGLHAFVAGRVIGQCIFSKAVWKLLWPQKEDGDDFSLSFASGVPLNGD